VRPAAAALQYIRSFNPVYRRPTARRWPVEKKTYCVRLEVTSQPRIWIQTDVEAEDAADAIVAAEERVIPLLTSGVQLRPIKAYQVEAPPAPRV
jgi:hypothetical protein